MNNIYNLTKLVIGKVLLITPILFCCHANAQVARQWATYTGGATDDGSPGAKVTTDASGNVYYCGTTNSVAGIASGGHQNSLAGGYDAYLVKLDASGNLVWATYYGGASDDWGMGVAVDASGNVYLGGHTRSNTGIASGGHDNTYAGGTVGDAYLVKFNSSGVRQWGTYYGGAAGDYGNSVAVDPSGNVYLTGSTDATTDIASGGFQNTTGGSGDAFLVKFNTSGLRIWGTYYGGTGGDGARAVTTDASGNVYIAGETTSTTAIASGGFDNTLGGGVDGFLVMFNSGGARTWATYYGGTLDDRAYGVAVDLSGNVFLSGYTKSTSSIASGGHQNTYGGGTNDGFLVKFTSSGARSWGTYYGGPADDASYECATDASGNVYLSGYTTSSTGIASGGFQNTYGINPDAFLVRFASNGSRIAATYYGDTGIETSYDVCLDPNGNIYISGNSNSSSNIAAGGYQNTLGGASDGMLVKFAACTAGPSAPGAISGSTTICEGVSTTYSVTAVSGATTYTWVLPSGWTGSSTTNSISVTPSSTSGTVSVTANNDCSNSSASTLSVTVNPLPSTPGSISGTSTICSGTSNTYSIATVLGATSYTWTLPSGWSGSSTTNSIPTTANANSGDITVTANNSCGSSSAQTLAITVNAAPSIPGLITGTSSICAGTSNSYSVINDPTATSYTWTLPFGWSGTSTTNSISTTANSNSGNISVTANNACGSSSAQTLAITVNSAPATPSSISGSSTICSGSSTTYSVTNDPSASSYTWTLPVGWSGTSTSNSLSVINNGTSGTISVVANNSCGSSSSSSLSITVNATPASPGTITGTTTVCSASTTTYSITAVPGATSYTWTLPGGWTGSSTSNSINATASSNSGTISVTANNACGSSSAQTLAITVNSAPSTPGTISGTTSICSGTSNSYSVTNDPSATSYTWTLPAAWTGTSSTNSINTTASSNSGSITVTANNACGSSSAQTLVITVNTSPATPGSISGSSAICAGSNNTYSVTNNPSATSYTWNLPGGWSGSSTTNSISATADASSGTISVTANNACGSSAAQNLAITVNTIPATPGSISGSNSICEGSSNNYSVAGVAGATSYTWTLPGGWSGTSTTNSITTTSSSTSGNITITANNSCGNSGMVSLSVVVNGLPNVSLSLPLDSLCTYSSPLSLSGASPSGGTFSGTNVSAGVFDPTASGAGTFTITYTFTDANSCTNTATDNIVVDACLGVEENDSDVFTVYPNPTIGLVNVASDFPFGTIRIYNALGEIIFSSLITTQNTSIDLSEIENGIYFVQVIVEQRFIATKKIIKE